MRKSSKATGILLTAALAVGSLTPCAVSASEESKVLNVALDFSAFETIDVMKTTYTQIFEISDCICETLMGKDPETLETYPLLVEDFPEVSEDGLVYTFRLKDGITFHDETPLDTEDVVYSFTRLFAPDTLCPMTWLVDMIAGAGDYAAGNADSVSGIAAVDDRTFTITLNYPYSPLIATLAASPLVIVPKEACEEAGDSWGVTTYVGTGPYVFESFESGSKLVLKKNEDYHGGAKNVDEIDFYCMDANTALLEYEAGTVDLCELPTELAEDYLNTEEFADNVNYQDYFGTFTLILNQDVAPFDNELVRQAFSLAVDRTAIAQGYFGGSVSEAYTFLPPGISGHDDSIVVERDVEKAKELLAEAGYPDGVTVTTYITGENDVLAILKEQVAEAGIDFDIQLADAATVSDMRTNGELACWILQWYADYNDADEFLYGIFHSSTADYFSTGNVDEDFDAKLDEARNITDEGEKAAIYQELDKKITYEKYGNVPLYYPGSYYLVSDRVTGITVKKDFLWWYVDADIQ